MQGVLMVNQKEYRILKLLGHGKGGYSYLAERDGHFYVVKQINHANITPLAIKSNRSGMIITSFCRQVSESLKCWILILKMNGC